MSLHDANRAIRMHLSYDLQDAVIRHVALGFLPYGYDEMIVAFLGDLLRACAGSDPDFDEHGADLCE